ncbi:MULTISPECIES: TonB-dependent receptor [unclassified Sphingomonas]|uniref:TonB-dependent receptor n=1 Tax=unclassified Sphingomonas TaxID=196159 RepID=UPI0025EEC03B|nr:MULTISPECIES: TonB-dependent receptor [unclassified Sphingomonas]
MTTRSYRLAGVALLALMPAPAWAQPIIQQPPEPQQQEQQQEQKAPAATAAAEPGDIVVTAQRRSERLQDVPIAITAATGEQLAQAHVENITNIQSLSPSIQFRSQANGASSANVIIRGLGTTGTSRAFEGAVGIFVDGVYRTRAAAVVQNFLDIDSLQILRGPQGTLFGKNTSAGAVLLTSTRPEATPTATGEWTVGNYGMVSVRGAVGAGLSDTVAVRVAGLYSGSDGFYTDPNDRRAIADSASHAVKAQILWEPSDRLSFQLIGDDAKSVGHCCFATSSYSPGAVQPLIDGLIRARGLRTPSPRLSDFEQVLSNPGRQVVRDYGGTLLASLAIGGDTIKSVSAIRKFVIDQRNGDADFSGADILNLDERFASRFLSQELTFNGKSAALHADYVLGGFVSDEQLDLGRNLRWGSQAQTFWNTLLGAGRVYAAPGLWSNEIMTGSAQSYALFAHADVELGKGWKLLGGLRYSIERKRGAFANGFYRNRPDDTFRVLGLMPAPAYDVATTDRALSGTLGAQYSFSRDAMVYLTYNRGFKAGGVILDANGAGGAANNPAIVAGARPLSPIYRPEKVNAFEFGGKFSYLDHRAHTNVAIFYNTVSDLQVAQFIGVQFTVLNARSAKTYGLELENSIRIGQALTLNLDGTWLPHARYGVDPSLSAMLSGQSVRFVPRLGGNASLNLDQPLGDRLALTGRVEVQYTGREYLDNSSKITRPPVTLLNANLGVDIADGGVRLELWGQNLTNRIYANAAFLAPLQGTTENAYMAPPRTFGLRTKFRY